MALVLLVLPIEVMAGYRVQIERSINKKTGRSAVGLTVVPIFAARVELIGVDEAKWQTESGESISHSDRKTLAKILIAEAQRAYHQIAANKGLFTPGDQFHRALLEKENALDGRSAIAVIYEDDSFSKPKATLRVSYPVSEDFRNFRELPFVERQGGSFEDYYPLTGGRTVRDPSKFPYDLGSQVGLLLMERMEKLASVLHPEMSMEAVSAAMQTWMRDAAIEYLRMGFDQARINAALGARAQAEYHRKVYELQTIANADPLKALALAASMRKHSDAKIEMQPIVSSNDYQAKLNEWIKRRGSVQVGGHPIELKGLSSVRGADGADYMGPVFSMALARGFFDLVPLELYGVMPDKVVAETTERHIAKYYKDWILEVLKTKEDPDRPGEKVVTVGMDRQALAHLMVRVLMRGAPFLADDEAFMKSHLAFTDDPDLAKRMSPKQKEELKARLGATMGALNMDEDKTWLYVPRPVHEVRNLGCMMGFSN